MEEFLVEKLPTGLNPAFIIRKMKTYGEISYYINCNEDYEEPIHLYKYFEGSYRLLLKQKYCKNLDILFKTHVFFKIKYVADKSTVRILSEQIY